MEKTYELGHAAISLATGAPHEAAHHARRFFTLQHAARAAADRNRLMMSSKPAETIRNALAIRDAQKSAFANTKNMNRIGNANALGLQAYSRQSVPKTIQPALPPYRVNESDESPYQPGKTQ